MKIQPTRRYLCIGGIALTMCAWLSASNHCTLMTLAAGVSSNASKTECSMHGHGKQRLPGKPGSESLTCCKILRAIVAPKLLRPIANLPVDLSRVDLASAKPIVRPKMAFGFRGISDTGPPVVSLFTELMTSMRAHAPPQKS